MSRTLCNSDTMCSVSKDMEEPELSIISTLLLPIFPEITVGCDVVPTVIVSYIGGLLLPGDICHPLQTSLRYFPASIDKLCDQH